MKTISSPTQYWRGLCLSSALALAVVAAGLSLSLTVPVTAQAQATDANRTLATGSHLPLSPSAPDRYTVKPGDTLWGISKLFLDQPWYWPELWYVNPQIKNPHLIYPGDVLALVNVEGQTRLTIAERGPAGAEAVTSGGATRLSPEVRSEPLTQAITAIPYNVIAAFMGRPSVLTLDEVKTAPHIVSLRDRHVLAGAGDDVYAVGIASAPEGARYNVVHVEEALRDPESNKLLGYRGIYVGNGPVVTTGNPAKIKLSESALEALAGDKLFAETYSINTDFVPHAPAKEVTGMIFAVNGVALAGQYQVIVINRGSKQGLEAGNVLSIMKAGETVRDRYADGRSANAMETPSGMFGKKVKLPSEQVGTAMVFKAYDSMSYALIMEATDTVTIGDQVRNP